MVKENKNIKIGIPKRVLAALALFIGIELAVIYNKYIIFIFLATALAVFLVNLWSIGFQVNKFSYVKRLNLPLVFFVSSFSFLLLIPSKPVSYVYGMVVGFVYFFLMRIIKLNKYTIKDEFNVNDIYLLMCAFMIFSGVFGYFIFLSLPSWTLMAITFVLCALLIYQYFWFEKILTKNNWIYIPITAFIFTEIAWGLTFWPNGFMSRGMILFILFYLFMGIYKLHVNNKIALKSLSKYLVVSVIVLGLIFSTTKWFF